MSPLEEVCMPQRGSGSGKGGIKHEVIDFNRVREEKMEEKRRSTERIFFTQLLGIYGVTGQEKMLSIELLDASFDGIAFKIPATAEEKIPKTLKILPIRLYFSQETYLPLEIKIQNSRPHIEDGIKYIRYGAVIDKTHGSYEAYEHFIKFMHAYSVHAHKDLGDVTLFYL